MEDREVLIIRYLENDLSPNERVSFINAMQSDESLKKEVEDLQVLTGYAAKRDRINDSINVLQEISKEESTSIDKHEKSNRTLWIGVLAIFLIGLLSLFLLRLIKPSSQQDDAQKIYATYFVHDQANFQTKGNNQDDELLRFQVLFNEEDYAQAIEEIDIRDYNNPELTFYYALALLQDGQDTAGVTLLDQLSSEAPLFKNEALYYQSLSFIKRGLISEARGSMLQIEPSSSKYKRAQEIINQLE